MLLKLRDAGVRVVAVLDGDVVAFLDVAQGGDAGQIELASDFCRGDGCDGHDAVAVFGEVVEERAVFSLCRDGGPVPPDREPAVERGAKGGPFGGEQPRNIGKGGLFVLAGSLGEFRGGVEIDRRRLGGVAPERGV